MRVQVYPEYYDGPLQSEGIEIYGRLTSATKSRMFLTVNGEVKISYDKIHSDGKNKGGNPDQEIDVFMIDEAVIGLVCCMDVNNPSLLTNVKDRLDASGSPNKIICISAHMTSDWFSSEMLSPDLHGYVVVLSNGNRDGVGSFVAGTDGMKLDSLSVNVGNLSIINSGYT